MRENINYNFDLRDKGLSNALDSINMPRHRWYFYKEGFSPKLVEKAINSSIFSTDSPLILDPFNGSGTTTLTASFLGLSSRGIEVNPFTSSLAELKQIRINPFSIENIKDNFFECVHSGQQSPLLNFSTFSEETGYEKWLFNSEILNSFEGGWSFTNNIKSKKLKDVLRLSLIIAAMQNCNAKRDGKCLRYRENWKEQKLSKNTFIKALNDILNIFQEDINNSKIHKEAHLLNSDIRDHRSTMGLQNFDLCITSPPYLNTFDYTDIYRPELFLGKYVHNNKDLYNLRLRTVRSHIQAKWKTPTNENFGLIYKNVFNEIFHKKNMLMDKRIPSMIQAYFEDMQKILNVLLTKCTSNGSLWLVVSNSAYANIEVPVDLILADIGSNLGWKLREIGVLRNVRKRKTKYSPDINSLRESVVIFDKKH
ncbi:MAG: hypothetical protein R2776_05360 [Flavobacteriaceae bacterium]